jgi:hypothetical protein
MLMQSDGLDGNCPGDKGETEPRIAAIVNWYGITDGGLTGGENRNRYASRGSAAQ